MSVPRQVREKGKVKNINAVWWGYAMAYGPPDRAGAEREEHKTIYIAYENLDTDTMCLLPEGEEVVEFWDWIDDGNAGLSVSRLGYFLFEFAAAAHQDFIEYDLEGNPVTCKGIPLTRSLVCPTEGCGESLGVGEVAFSSCVKCKGGTAFFPGSGVARTRNARIATQLRVEQSLRQLSAPYSGTSVDIDPDDPDYQYEEDEDELMVDDMTLAIRSKYTCLRAPPPLSPDPYAPYPDVANATGICISSISLAELDGTSDELEHAIKALPHLEAALLAKDVEQDTQRTQGKSASLTHQVEVGLYNHPTMGKHAELLEPFLGGRGVDVSVESLRALPPEQGALLESMPVAKQHRLSDELKANLFINSALERSLRHAKLVDDQHVANQAVNPAAAQRVLNNRHAMQVQWWPVHNGYREPCPKRQAALRSSLGTAYGSLSKDELFVQVCHLTVPSLHALIPAPPPSLLHLPPCYIHAPSVLHPCSISLHARSVHLT